MSDAQTIAPEEIDHADEYDTLNGYEDAADHADDYEANEDGQIDAPRSDGSDDDGPQNAPRPEAPPTSHSTVRGGLPAYLSQLCDAKAFEPEELADVHPRQCMIVLKGPEGQARIPAAHLAPNALEQIRRHVGAGHVTGELQDVSGVLFFAINVPEADHAADLSPVDRRLAKIERMLERGGASQADDPLGRLGRDYMERKFAAFAEGVESGEHTGAKAQTMAEQMREIRKALIEYDKLEGIVKPAEIVREVESEGGLDLNKLLENPLVQQVATPLLNVLVGIVAQKAGGVASE